MEQCIQESGGLFKATNERKEGKFVFSCGTSWNGILESIDHYNLIMWNLTYQDDGCCKYIIFNLILKEIIGNLMIEIMY